MKILHVTASIDPQMGGVTQAIKTMVEGLETKGINNTVVSVDAENAPFAVTINFHPIFLGPAKGPWKYSARLMPWLKENLNYYDIILVHGLWLYHSYAVNKAIFALADTNTTKVFVMPHGMLDPYFQNSASRKIKAVRNWLYWKLIEQKVINKAYGLLFTCEEEKCLARKTFLPYMPKRELIAGLEVNNPPALSNEMQDAFSKKCPAAANHPYILFIGRIDEKKGVDLLISAYTSLFQKLSGKQTEQIPLLIIAGPDPLSSFGQKMQSLAFENPVFRNKIFFPGMLSGDAKWGAFYFCDAFILPSHQENFGIAVAEALACSKPVLISNKINIWREIENAEAGIVKDDTLQGTEELLHQWITLSFEKKTIMKKKARACFELNFANPKATNKLISAILS